MLVKRRFLGRDQAGVQARSVVIGIAGELVKGTTNTIQL